ncbi:MAG: NAD-dependent epimerase/dehydratase family protein [Bacteroidales bacterium]
MTNTLNVLITGAYGFVGTNLAEYFKTKGGCRLEALDIKKRSGIYDTYHSWSDIQCVDWDSYDAVIHLAGMAHDTSNSTNPDKYFEINTGLTKKVFDCFIKSNARNFIFFSSVKAVADTVPGNILTEEDIANPKTPYGKSKKEAEEYIASKKEEIGKEKNIYILRPAMIHGPGNKGNLNLLYKVVSKGIPWPLGAFENKRSFTSIDNLCYVVERLAHGDIASGTYQMSDDEPLSTNDLIGHIAKSIGHKPHIFKINQKLIAAVAKVGDLTHLPLNSERLKKLTESYIVANAKIKKALNIENMPVTACDGLKKTLESFR